jgi:hypothetical protein
VKIINQYSAVWIGVLLVAVSGVILLRHGPKWPQFLGFSIVVIILVVAWFIFHPIQTNKVTDAAQVQARIGAGIPVLLEFQSPY